MSDDNMRAEFEKWATANARELDNCLVMCKGKFVYTYQAELAFKIYAAGRKAEREAIQREREEWSKAVNKAWIETANTREGQL